MNEKNPDKMSERELRLEVKERRAADPTFEIKDASAFLIHPQKFVITFHLSDSTEVAKLFETDDGQLDFEGEVTEAAKIFFRDIVRLNSLHIREMEEELRDRQR